MKQFQATNTGQQAKGIQSELPAIRTFVVYRYEDERLYGYEVEHKPYPASTEGYEFARCIFGKRGRFCFVSHDGSIAYSELLHFGSALVNGTFSVFKCDLSSIQGRVKK